MTVNNRLSLLSKLQTFLLSDSAELEKAKQQAYVKNRWFTIENQNQAIKIIANYYLDNEQLENWMLKYPDEYFETKNPKKVGLIMAGNLPLVGFHDFLAVFLSGHKARIKLSSKDEVLFKCILRFMIQQMPEVSTLVQVVDKLKDFEAVIATGSNNSNRYFEYYFKKVPNLLRKNRTSVAVINNKTSDDELGLLANDCFDYFGLGCRNVSKIFLPEGFEFDRLFKAFEHKSTIQHHNKFKNNFDYNLAIYLLNKDEVKTNDWFTMKESEALFSPLSVLFYEMYKDPKTVELKLAQQQDDIQCVISNKESHTPFGKGQQPQLWDYADGVDTIKFLGNL